MNERIKQLAEQARAEVRADWAKGNKIPYPEAHYAFQRDNDQKFAELIVEECAKLFVDQRYMVLNPHEPFANERIRALKDHDMDTVRKIKGHFGVK